MPTRSDCSDNIAPLVLSGAVYDTSMVGFAVFIIFVGVCPKGNYKYDFLNFCSYIMLVRLFQRQLLL